MKPPKFASARDAVHDSSGKCALRIGMGCKAQNAAIAVAIASICNAADRPRPQMHTARRIVQSIPKTHAGAALVGATGWCSNAARRALARPMGAQTPTLTPSEET